MPNPIDNPLSDNPYAPSASPRPRRPPAREAASDVAPLRHSGMGIWSFGLSLFTGFATLGLIVAVGYLVIEHPEIGESDSHPALFAIGLGAITIGLSGMTAFGLGVASLFQRDRKKTFGVIGLVLTGLMGICMLGLLVIGAMG